MIEWGQGLGFSRGLRTVSCKVGYETLAKEWRSRFGGGHFPKSSERSSSVEESPSSTVSSRHCNPRFKGRPVADRRIWHLGNWRSGRSLDRRRGPRGIPSLAARNFGTSATQHVDAVAVSVCVSRCYQRMGSSPVAAAAY